MNEEYSCNGICITAFEIGVYVAGNPVAYPHPECDKHGNKELENE